MNTNRVSHPDIKSERGSAFLWGCAGVIGFGLFIVIAIAVGLFVTAYQIREKFTDDTSIELPRVEASESVIEATIEKADDFLSKIDEGTATSDLVLTQEELNVLIQNHPKLEDLDGVVYLIIDDDTLTGQLSIPLYQIPGFEGRYFNGVAEFDVIMENGELEVYVLDAEINGESVPDSLMDELRRENLADDSHGSDPDLKKIEEALSSIKITDGTVILTPHEK